MLFHNLKICDVFWRPHWQTSFSHVRSFLASSAHVSQDIVLFSYWCFLPELCLSAGKHIFQGLSIADGNSLLSESLPLSPKARAFAMLTSQTCTPSNTSYLKARYSYLIGWSCFCVTWTFGNGLEHLWRITDLLTSSYLPTSGTKLRAFFIFPVCLYMKVEWLINLKLFLRSCSMSHSLST